MSKKGEKSVPVSVCLISLGCPKNTVDSERMLAVIAEAGFFITAEPELAEVVVINTCGFIESACREAFEHINSAIGLKSRGIIKKVIVCGCLSERLGGTLLTRSPGIDAVVGLGHRDEIADIIRCSLSSNEPAAYLGGFGGSAGDDRKRLITGPHHRAYLRISEGCDHGCSFCTIPAIRGRFCSKPEQLVISEASELADSGVVELNIIAQDTAAYGNDLKLKNGLAGLLHKLSQIDRISWIRLMYLYPSGITQRLIEVVAESEKVVHYLDVPVQHISDPVLRAMGRPEKGSSICRLIERLRSRLPDVVLRTTVMVGFPGETESRFRAAGFRPLGPFQCAGLFRIFSRVRHSRCGNAPSD